MSYNKYTESLKKRIWETLCLLDKQHLTEKHLKWEYLNIRFKNSQKNMPEP